MLNQLNGEKNWSRTKIEILNAAPVAQVRQRVLSLFPHPSLFETGPGFQLADGKETVFMVDLLFELKLVNNTWKIDGIDAFVSGVKQYEEVLYDDTKTLWEKLRFIQKILNLPEDYTIALVLSYSAARFVENLPNMQVAENEPEVVMRVYRYIIRYDIEKTGAKLDILYQEEEEEFCLKPILDALKKPKEDISEKQVEISGEIKDLQRCEDFCNAVMEAKEYIKSGDIYQIQLCRHEFSNVEIAPVELYERLVKINPAPYMYYMDLDDVHIISSSPELMIRYDNGVAQARPIAGTMSKSDKRNERLDCIPKEEAEHLMLVDLARNDIARCAVKGGVNVPSFMALEDYGKLYHLVSTVESQVQDKYDIWDIIPANFPAGTMTGAPKVRAMQLIADFEQAPRGLFTGCVGMITGNKKGVLALTIRTIIGDSGNYSLNACAGIVADSQPMAEWEEAGAKIQSFARILNNK